MTREEAKQIFLSRGYIEVEGGSIYDPNKWREACVIISDWLEQEPCEDAISRKRVVEWLENVTDDSIEHAIDSNLEFIPSITPQPCEDAISRKAVLNIIDSDWKYEGMEQYINDLPPVNPQPQIGHCKECKYFEYDSGIPLIVAHEICSRWGNGCKTKEDGYCFLFEPIISKNPTDSKDVMWYSNKNYSEIVVEPQEGEVKE